MKDDILCELFVDMYSDVSDEVKLKFWILTVTSHLVHVNDHELVTYFLQARVKQVK